MPKKGTTIFHATDAQRELVEQMTGMGCSLDQVGGVLKVSHDTIQRHFKHELATAVARANTKVAGALFQNAMGGNVTAQIFWLKTRARWREVNEIEVTATQIIPSITISVNKP